MLSIHHIERYYRQGHFELLLRGVSPHAIELPLPLIVRLSQQPAAVIALALRRVTELSYGPTRLSRVLTADLLRRQSPDGSFDGDPLSTAAAADALSRVLTEHGSQADAERLTAAREAALSSLGVMQNQAGLLAGPADRTEQDAALSSAFILSLLAGDPGFRAAVRYHDLLDYFADHDARLSDAIAELWRFAQADAPTAVPAIAA